MAIDDLIQLLLKAKADGCLAVYIEDAEFGLPDVNTPYDVIIDKDGDAVIKIN